VRARAHALAVAHSSARVSLCTCACLYVPVCQCVHVISCVACVCMIMVAGAAGAVTGLGGGQRRLKIHPLSVRPPTKLYFRQHGATPEPQNKYIINDTSIIPGKKRHLPGVIQGKKWYAIKGVPASSRGSMRSSLVKP